jgi:2-dehydro-3-deoxyphosphogluconate aldolase/(4S)-4-hydroxy-2-oxoglutarate aldolase
MPNDPIARLSALGVVPVVTLDRIADAVPVAEALVAGGLSCIEITFRTEAAAASIRRIRDEVPEIVLLAGTVLSVEQVNAAVAAGAEVIVAPGLNHAVVERSLERGVPIVPGIATPTELEMALGQGLRVVKFFPAEPLGGIPYLKALAGPYPGVGFVPTGGVNPGNLAEYLGLENVVAVGGTWLVRPETVENRDFARITALAAEAMAIVREIRSVPAREQGTVR